MALVNILKNSTNPYLEDVTFGKYTSNQALRYQMVKMAVILRRLQRCDFIISEGNFYDNIIGDIKRRPEKYAPITVEKYTQAVKHIIARCEEVWKMSRNNEYDVDLYKNGFSILSTNFYEDVCSGQINGAQFANALVAINASL